MLNDTATPLTEVQPAQRVYTAADYKATVAEIDASLKRLHGERKELHANIEFPHIVAGRIRHLEPQIEALKNELAEKLAMLEECHRLQDTESQQKLLQSVYAKIDSETEARKLYHAEYVRLAEIEKTTAEVAKPIDQLTALVAKMDKAEVASILTQFLATLGK